MLDVAQIRHFYFNPPPADPERIPSREELYARAERRAVEDCILSGGDPRDQGLGEHGALIGEGSKPPRHYSRDPDLAGRGRTPLPLPWFEHPQAIAKPSTPPAEVHAFFEHLSGAHLAGYPDRLRGRALARAFQAAGMTSVQRDQVWHVFACIHPWDLPGLLAEGGMSVHQVARAIHLSKTRRAQVIEWINLFGASPTHEDQVQSVF